MTYVGTERWDRSGPADMVSENSRQQLYWQHFYDHFISHDIGAYTDTLATLDCCYAGIAVRSRISRSSQLLVAGDAHSPVLVLEDYLVSLVEDTNLCAIHAKRVTIQPK